MFRIEKVVEGVKLLAYCLFQLAENSHRCYPYKRKALLFSMLRAILQTWFYFRSGWDTPQIAWFRVLFQLARKSKQSGLINIFLHTLGWGEHPGLIKWSMVDGELRFFYIPMLVTSWTSRSTLAIFLNLSTWGNSSSGALGSIWRLASPVFLEIEQSRLSCSMAHFQIYHLSPKRNWKQCLCKILEG